MNPTKPFIPRTFSEVNALVVRRELAGENLTREDLKEITETYNSGVHVAHRHIELLHESALLLLQKFKSEGNKSKATTVQFMLDGLEEVYKADIFNALEEDIDSLLSEKSDCDD